MIRMRCNALDVNIITGGDISQQITSQEIEARILDSQEMYLSCIDSTVRTDKETSLASN